MLKKMGLTPATASEEKLSPHQTADIAAIPSKTRRSKHRAAGNRELPSAPRSDPADNSSHARLQRQKMEVVGELTTGIAHDLKNLLTVLNGNLEMLAMTRAHDLGERSRLVAEACRVGSVMTQLAANLLAYAREEPLDRSVVEIGEIARTTAGFLLRILGDGIAVDLEIRTSSKASINLAQFQTALMNLAINARDAMPCGGRVVIGVEEALLDGAQASALRVKSGPFVVVRVTDHGRGMPKETLRRAFDPFFTTKPQGNGMGLATVREFAKAVGGTVRVSSEVGRGTTFELWIPSENNHERG